MPRCQRRSYFIDTSVVVDAVSPHAIYNRTEEILAKNPVDDFEKQRELVLSDPTMVMRLQRMH